MRTHPQILTSEVSQVCQFTDELNRLTCVSDFDKPVLIGIACLWWDPSLRDNVYAESLLHVYDKLDYVRVDTQQTCGTLPPCH